MAEEIEPLGKLLENGTIIFERRLPGPIERIWAYIIDGDMRARWLAGGDMPTTAGATGVLEFHHSTLTDDQPPAKYAGFDRPMTMDYEVVASRPPHHISFTWPEVGPHNPHNRLSIVAIDLAEAGDQVVLRLTHSQVGHDTDNLVGLLGGWQTHLGLLADAAAGGEKRPFWATHVQNEKLYREHYAAELAGMSQAAMTHTNGG